ncbi:MAG: pseudaminic acid biosynthesis-associated methylase [Actinomycetia bacterium]|jgi:spore coat polysaccharide biosynthesis protein SpsF|nr:pseudaminic acid biosynthesis-associated methylase [Actinomycetes bacterium]
MTSTNTKSSEAGRLEELWSGEFGNEYVDRNLDAYDRRGEFWLPLLDELQPESVLEVGCNVGGNLQWITQRVDPAHVTGVDVNAKALRLLDQRVPGIRGMYAPARELPLGDRSVDFVFTMGVLIHQPEETLEKVMSEMVRTSRKYVFCGEYFDTETVEVPYRGHERALFRRNYGNLFLDLFPHELSLVREGYLSPEDGWDRVTWWLFERA